MADSFHLSPQQRRLWQLHNSEPTPAYVSRCVIEVEGRLDHGVLATALAQIVGRHEILRTSFARLPDFVEPLQTVHPTYPVAVEAFDFRDLPESDHGRELADLIERLSFWDLRQGTPLHAAVVALATNRHALVLSLPALCADGPSLSCLAREVAGAYGQELGLDSSLPEVIQYADVAEIFNEILAAEDSEAGRRFWRDRMPVAAADPLPFERNGAGHGDFVPRSRAIEVPVDWAAGWVPSRSERGTALLAAWRVLFDRLSGGRDFVLGARFDGRDYEGLSTAIGPFTRWLPVSIPLEPGWTLSEVCSAARGALADLSPQQDYFCWGSLPNGAPSDYGACFEVLEIPPVLAVGGIDFRLADSFSRCEPFRIKLIGRLCEDRLAADLEFDLSHFDPAPIDRIAGYFSALLASAESDGRRPICELELLSAAERRQLLVDRNATCFDHPEPRLLHDAFERAAEASPDSVALVDGSLQLTYRELNRRSDLLALRLADAGVSPDALVAIDAARSAQMVIGLLGILKAGGAFMPLDPEAPDLRLKEVIGQARPLVVLATGESIVRLTLLARGVQVIPFDAEEGMELLPDTAVVPAAADNLAYVLFTSGSTGRPKGVAISHGAIANRILWMRRVFPLDRADVVLQKTSAAFDASIWEVFSPLSIGARLELAEPGGHRDTAYLASALTERQVTVLQMVPSMLAPLIEEQGLSDARALRQVFAGGEALPVQLQRRFFLRCRAELINLYGPTEVSIDATSSLCRREEEAGTTSIGQPIDNMKIHILGSGGELLPTGLPGEIFIGGPGLARGYFGRPMLTAERFVPDPFAAQAGARLYRTGDQGSYLADGTIEFRGRTDHQIKLRGQRIELGEIEALLGEHPGVREVAVKVDEPRSGIRRLVAYFSPSRDATTPGDLRDFASTRLPEAMVPAVFVRIDEMPRSAAGKIDRKALPDVASEVVDAEGAYVAPRNATERLIAEIFRGFLRVERVGVHDNFFELGGDSILSIQVAGRARKSGLQLSPRQLFQYQTVARLAEVVTATGGSDGAQGRAIGEAPLTPIQRQFFSRGLAAPHHFNQGIMLAVRRAIDPVRLSRALRELVEHHDALRLRFLEIDGEWQQVHRDDAGSSSLTVIDLRRVPDQELSGSIKAAVAQVQRGFDLGTGPLLRGALFLAGGVRPDRLLLVGHHLVVDGVSWRILLEDLETGYRQLEAGGKIELPPKTTSFKAWGERLVELLIEPDLEAELEEWLATEGSAVPSLPVDFPEGENTVGTEANIAVELDPEETKALLQDVPVAFGSRINEALLMALGSALAAWTGSERQVVDLEGHGREEGAFEDIDLSRTVGWFTSMYPVLLDLDLRSDVTEKLQTVIQHVRGIRRNGLGYGVLKYLSVPDVGSRFLARTVAQVSFNYLGQMDSIFPEESSFLPARESAGPAHDPEARREYLFDIAAEVASGRLRVEWNYGRHLYRPETVRALADSFIAALRELIAASRTSGARALTPEDFPLARIDAERLARLFEQVGAIEDIYPLTPLQQGLLFHSLEAPTEGVYFHQIACTVEGDLHVAAFERAWQRAVERHPILRTAFLQMGVGEPLQVVLPTVRLPWRNLDWRGLDAAELRRRRDTLLEEDRQAGFDVATAPLMRCALIRVGPSTWEFVWSHHHLVMDGWSAPLVISNVANFYAAEVGRREVQLDTPRPFRDYLEWLARRDQGQAEAYWKKAMAGFATPTPLGGELSAGTAYEGSQHGEQSLALSQAATESLKAFARQQQLTLNTVVQGAWGLLLWCYGGQADVVYGVVVSGRPSELERVESMVGVFINTLPARMRVTDEDVLAPWLRHLQEEQAEARQHDTTPLVSIQGWSEVPRGVPLFESILVFENFPSGSTSGRGSDLQVRVENASSIIRANYPIAVTAAPGDRLVLEFRYARDRFSDDSIARRMLHLSTLLEGFAQSGGRPLREISMLTAAELQQVTEWGAGERRPASVRTFHELFERWVDLNPQALAIRCEERTLTYGDLESRANRLAHRLRGLGVGPEILIALFSDRTESLIVGVLGILKAGGAYLPLDPGLPRERLLQLLQGGGVEIVVAEERLQAKLVGLGPRIISIEEAGDATPEDGRRPSALASPESLAYVIFTSGSTGQPKGVAVEHRQLVNYVEGAVERLDLPERAGFALLSSVAADLGNTALFGAFARGGWLLLVPEETAGDPEALAAVLARTPVDGLKIVPSHLTALQAASRFPERISPSRRLILGGEAATWSEIERLRALAPECAIYNHYGPTECTVGVLTHRISEKVPWTSSPALGRPLPNIVLAVLDPMGRQVPIGVAGELWIAGAGLARGYLGCPDVTVDRFRPDLSAVEPGLRRYGTGDLVHYLANGDLEFLGRFDHQVKVRGFRVELGEIERTLEGCRGVSEAVAMVRDDGEHGRRLVAYVIGQGSHAVTVGGRPRYRLLNGLAIVHQTERETDFLYREIFERQGYFRHGVELPEQGCVIDVGANIGLFTLFVGLLRPKLRLYAFEPAPEVAAALRANIDLYGLSAVPCEFGLAESERTASFAYYPGYSTMSGLAAYADSAGEVELLKRLAADAEGLLPEGAEELFAGWFQPQSQEIRLRPLSTVLREEGIESVDLLKVDVQRAELDVLLGIDAADWPKIRQVVVEVHDAPGALTDGRVATIRDLLVENGFEVTIDQEEKLVGTDRFDLFAVRPQVAAAADRRASPYPVPNFGHLSAPLSGGSLRAALEERLPEHMIPSAIVVLEDFPRLPNGKVDRKSLPVSGAQIVSPADVFVAPRGPLEEELAGIWSEILKIDRVGAFDDFFDLGGHSLLAMQAVSRLRRRFEVDLPLRRFAENANVAAMAIAVTDLRAQRFGAAELETALAEIAGLSEDEVRSLLGE